MAVENSPRKSNESSYVEDLEKCCSAGGVVGWVRIGGGGCGSGCGSGSGGVGGGGGGGGGVYKAKSGMLD